MTQEEFYAMIPEWIEKERSRWNHITLMAYFCHKYEQKNGVRFRLVRWKEDPGKGKESRDFAKLFKTFAPEEYDDLPSASKIEIKGKVINKIYNYINWMFDYKFRSGDKSVTGTNLFLMPSMINEFERMYSSYLQKNNKIDKFSEFLKWTKDNHLEIFERHQLEDETDLKILSKYVIMYDDGKPSIEKMVIEKAKEMGILQDE